jgi:hypothetical protein
MVMARMTPEGLKILARLDEPVQAVHHKQLGHLGIDRLSALTELLGAARAKTIQNFCIVVVVTISVITHIGKER